MLGTATPALAVTTTSLYATGVTQPVASLWLPGATTSHEWVVDAANGLCRLDGPDASGTFSENNVTCNRSARIFGQVSFDPRVNPDGSHYVYVPDAGINSPGVTRFVFGPDNDAGNGSISILGEVILAPGLGLQNSRASATVLGPDGNLYVGTLLGGNLERITNPDGGIQTVETIGATSARGISRLAFVGPDLWLIDANGLEIIPDAAACTGSCLATTAPVPAGLAGVTSIASDGTSVYLGTATTLFQLALSTGTLTPLATTGSLPTGQSSAVANISSLNLDANGNLFAGDDPTGGAFSLQGRVWRVNLAPTLAPVLPGAPTGVTATAGDAQATVTWSVPLVAGSSPISSYEVTSSLGTSVSVAAPATSATFTGLTPGETYTFTVVAISAVGDGPASAPSNPVVPFTTPSAPSAVSATAGNAQATVNWTASASDGFSPITSYTVTSSPAGASITVTAPVGTAAVPTSATVLGLTNGTAYSFTVTATNAAGSSPPSLPSASVTPIGPAPPRPPVFTLPGAPTGVTATAGNAQATVRWTAPASDGGTPITRYTVTASPGGVTVSAPPNATSATVGGLTPGTTYTFTVTATNAAGTGPASAPSNSVTPFTILADVQVVGAASNGGPLHGTGFSYTWQVKNNSGAMAPGVVFTDQLPAGLVYVSAVSSVGACTQTLGTVTCDLGDRPVGAEATVTINVIAPPRPRILSNMGSVSFNGTVTQPAHSSFAVAVRVR